MTAADTFAELVAHFADVLDEDGAPPVSGEEWAARFHFSRFHFDRMIRSAAGEPPQAFRRRILLERAAYRMLATKAPPPRHRRRGGLRVARGLHASVHQGVRRGAGRVATGTRPDPDRRSQ